MNKYKKLWKELRLYLEEEYKVTPEEVLYFMDEAEEFYEENGLYARIWIHFVQYIKNQKLRKEKNKIKDKEYSVLLKIINEIKELEDFRELKSIEGKANYPAAWAWISFQLKNTYKIKKYIKKLKEIETMVKKGLLNEKEE